jgi:hypothetical protein
MKADANISILLPTRGRTESLRRSLHSLINLAHDVSDIELLLGFDDDDRATVDYFLDHIVPDLDCQGVTYTASEFPPMGYVRLNEYVNALADQARGQWLMFWNDDAVMHTQDWDLRIRDHDGKFRVLRMPTHNMHPYAIFPIIPREWRDLFGYVSAHQLNDAWISQIAYMLDIMINIPVEVTHDRKDLTGNNDDGTYRGRIMLEGRPSDPRDFNHITARNHRVNCAGQICDMLEKRGEDMTWFRSVIAARQDPWAKMISAEFDPNGQLKVFR